MKSKTTNAKFISHILKIGAENHMDSFLYTGEMHLKTVQSFKQMDENIERYDKHEAATEIKQVNWIKLQNTETGKKFEFSKNGATKNELLSAYFITNDDSFQGNIFSCTAITSDSQQKFTKLDRRFGLFGNSVILISNPAAFIGRVTSELKRQNFKFKLGLVNYYDLNKTSGQLSVFNKTNRYLYQNEFRIFVQNESNEPITIRLGSIDNIAKKFRIEGILQ